MTLMKLAVSLLVAVAVLGGCAALVDTRADTREAQTEARFPAEGRFVLVNGKRVHAEVFGKGPDLVLIHGAGGNTRDFTFELVDLLKDRYRVTVFDRPGMGYSDGLGPGNNSVMAQAGVLRAAAADLGLRRPIVLGHSYGGAVAMAWGLQAPDDTAALVILSGATMPFPGDLAFWYKATGSRVGSNFVAPLLSAFVTKGLADQSIESIYKPETPPAGYADYIGAGLTLRRSSLRANGEQVLALKGDLVAQAPAYPGLTLPVEIVHGLADKTVPADIHAVPMSKALPDANLTLIAGAGHMIHHTQHREVLAAIDRARARSR